MSGGFGLTLARFGVPPIVMDPAIECFEPQLIFGRFCFNMESGMVIAKVTL